MQSTIILTRFENSNDKKQNIQAKQQARLEHFRSEAPPKTAT